MYEQRIHQPGSPYRPRRVTQPAVWLVLELEAFRESLDVDLIDLAALREAFGPVPEEAWSKAEGAYKSAAGDDLRKALALFTEDLIFQRRCFEGLHVRDRAQILRGISQLATDLDS